MKVSTIVAHAKNKAIGVNNGLPWKLKDDFQNYKNITMGHCLVMGRKTFESIVHPLKGRTSIVVTRNKDYKTPEGVYVCHSVEEGIEIARGLNDTECFINGGEAIYKLGLPYVTCAYITEVDCVIENADSFFPKADFSRWKITEEFIHHKDERNDHEWHFKKYVK